MRSRSLLGGSAAIGHSKSHHLALEINGRAGSFFSAALRKFRTGADQGQTKRLFGTTQVPTRPRANNTGEQAAPCQPSRGTRRRVVQLELPSLQSCPPPPPVGRGRPVWPGPGHLTAQSVQCTLSPHCYFVHSRLVSERKRCLGNLFLHLPPEHL